MKFSEMPYERPDMSALKEQFAALTERLQSAPDYAAARAAFLEEQVLNKHFSKVLDREETDKERQKRENRIRRMEAAREQQRKIAAEEAEKKTLKEKRAEKQAAKATKKKNSTNESGRVGDRPYARGRSYDPEHYGE